MAYPRFLRSRSFKFVTRTAGDVAVTSTAWTGLSAFDMTGLNAQVGDVLAVGVNFSTGTDTAPAMNFDFATMNGSTPINYLSSGTGTPATYGVIGWQVQSGATLGFLGRTGSWYYTVQASDIINGKVALRLYAQLASAGTRTINSSSGIPGQVNVQNLGPVDPN